jgi:hypothetical protein
MQNQADIMHDMIRSHSSTGAPIVHPKNHLIAGDSTLHTTMHDDGKSGEASNALKVKKVLALLSNVLTRCDL